MQQTTLNLIALGIFLMTVSVLLGPLIHLPQIVPTVATLGVLTLATVDRFAWDGRAGTLVVDGFARLSAANRDRVLHHEAGHFLVAHLYEIPIAAYSLSAWEAFRQGQPGYGGVQFAPQLQPVPEEIVVQKQMIDRYCVTFMAGIAAEKRTYKDVQGGGDDRRQVTAMLSALGQSQEAIRLKLQWAQLQADNLLERHAAAYAALVDAMRDRAPVAVCIQVLEQNLLTSGES